MSKVSFNACVTVPCLRMQLIKCVEFIRDVAKLDPNKQEENDYRTIVTVSQELYSELKQILDIR